MTLAEQYELASNRHQDLNERFAGVQAEISQDQWRDGSVNSEVVPGQGGTRADDLPGATNDNSYYFAVSRWYVEDGDLKPLLEKIVQLWEARDWDVGTEIYGNGAMRVTTMTPEGFWFAAEEQQGKLKLTGMSPVYWGERRALSREVAQRRDAQDEAGAHWDTTDRDELGHAYRLPGDFRPFPAWAVLE